MFQTLLYYIIIYLNLYSFAFPYTFSAGDWRGQNDISSPDAEANHDVKLPSDTLHKIHPSVTPNPWSANHFFSKDTCEADVSVPL